MKRARIILLAGIIIALALAAFRVATRRTPLPLRAGKTLFVDCSMRTPGDGSARRPWNELHRVSSVRLGPGSRVLLRRGSTCHGALAPEGSGSVTQPILIGAYGSGSPPRILADGRFPDALRLAAEAYVIVQDLDLSNPGNGTTPLRGVHVVALESGQPHDVVLQRLRIHNVGGADVKGLDGSGAIQIDDPSRNITIADNSIDTVNRSGIWVAGGGVDPRPRAGRPWPSATTGVVIRGNHVSRMGGDGIVPTGTVGARIFANVVCCGNLRGRHGRQFDAGIWTFDANGTVIERNIVHDMVDARADGTAYDIDYDQDGTVLQYNIGYRNAGGFVLLCGDSEPRAATVRFNLSFDELAFSEGPCQPRARARRTLSGLSVLNNTFALSTSGVLYSHRALLEQLPDAGSFRFANNLVFAVRPLRLPLPCGRRCEHNLFWGLPPSGTAAVHQDPRLRGATGAVVAALRAASGPPGGEPRAGGSSAVGLLGLRLAVPFVPRPRSPAVGAGVSLPLSARRDFFGRPITGAPPIGISGAG